MWLATASVVVYMRTILWSVGACVKPSHTSCPPPVTSITSPFTSLLPLFACRAVLWVMCSCGGFEGVFLSSGVCVSSVVVVRCFSDLFSWLWRRVLVNSTTHALEDCAEEDLKTSWRCGAPEDRRIMPQSAYFR
ncbi:hypothetical protein O3P69_012894 [Scylla paramamosain]|uniref:Secreted protein n=1 Tax=Scylla paramamosain TaxID=85552 RepID=A0AAW0TRI7_SCYPA